MVGVSEVIPSKHTAARDLRECKQKNLDISRFKSGPAATKPFALAISSPYCLVREAPAASLDDIGKFDFVKSRERRTARKNRFIS